MLKTMLQNQIRGRTNARKGCSHRPSSARFRIQWWNSRVNARNILLKCKGTLALARSHSREKWNTLIQFHGLLAMILTQRKIVDDWKSDLTEPIISIAFISEYDQAQGDNDCIQDRRQLEMTPLSCANWQTMGQIINRGYEIILYNFHEKCRILSSHKAGESEKVWMKLPPWDFSRVSFRLPLI